MPDVAALHRGFGGQHPGVGCQRLHRVRQPARLLAVLLEVVGVALVVAVLRLRRPRPDGWIRLATVQVLVVPLQAVIGGLLVLSHLNPYVLILHFLVSFPLITAAAMLLARVVTPGARMRRGHPELRWLTGALVSAAALVLVLGTVVTGTGPHAGSRDIARLPFDPREVTHDGGPVGPRGNGEIEHDRRRRIGGDRP